VGIVWRWGGVRCVIIERLIVLVVMYRVQACACNTDGGDQQQSLHCHLSIDYLFISCRSESSKY